MPYKSNQDLPESVRNVLPSHGQDIFRDVYNSAYDEYEDKKDRRGSKTREEVAFKVAWSAVKKSYQKGDDGQWHPEK